MRSHLTSASLTRAASRPEPQVTPTKPSSSRGRLSMAESRQSTISLPVTGTRRGTLVPKASQFLVVNDSSIQSSGPPPVQLTENAPFRPQRRSSLGFGRHHRKTSSGSTNFGKEERSRVFLDLFEPPNEIMRGIADRKPKQGRLVDQDSDLPPTKRCPSKASTRAKVHSRESSIDELTPPSLPECCHK